MMPPFAPFTLQHGLPVAAVAAIAWGLVFWARRQEMATRRRVGHGLGALLITYYLVESVVRVQWLGFTTVQMLPLEMCSALFFIGAYAYGTEKRLAFELVYFWTFAGTLHALVTPTPRAGFPDLNYFQYFCAHGLLIVSAMYAVWALHQSPGRGAVLRAFLCLQMFVLLVAAVDFWTGENFMFLRHKPPYPTVLDVFGDWPEYILGGEAVAAVSFALWALPWLKARTGNQHPNQ